jgi:hypothetical protein
MSPKSFYLRWLDASAPRPAMGHFGVWSDAGPRDAREFGRRNSLSRLQLDQSDTVGIVGTEPAKQDWMGVKSRTREWQPADRTDLR